MKEILFNLGLIMICFGLTKLLIAYLVWRKDRRNV